MIQYLFLKRGDISRFYKAWHKSLGKSNELGGAIGKQRIFAEMGRELRVIQVESLCRICEKREDSELGLSRTKESLLNKLV